MTVDGINIIRMNTGMSNRIFDTLLNSNQLGAVIVPRPRCPPEFTFPPNTSA
jgi:hypothetical protein